MNSRERIAAAARREFGRHGYAGARVARVAREAGVNKQLIFYYFGSKRELYFQVAEQAVADASTSASAPSGTPIESLRDAVRDLCAALAGSPELIALLTDRGTPGQDAADTARQATRRLAAPVAAAVSEGQGLGYFRDDVDPATVAQHALAFSVGQVALQQPATENARWQESLSDILLRAISW